MKIVVTYESKDIVRLIKQDLAQQGIISDDVGIKYSKGQAVVTVEMSAEDAAARTPVTPPAAAPATPPPAAPALKTIDGGNAPVDMNDVLSASERLAAANAGRYNPSKRSLMQGESYDWPGTK